MITTESGLTFAKDGNGWRCLQFPGLRMLPSGAYVVSGVEGQFRNARDAVTAWRQKAIQDTPPEGLGVRLKC
jgi:hypothetical protein